MNGSEKTARAMVAAVDRRKAISTDYIEAALAGFENMIAHGSMTADDRHGRRLLLADARRELRRIKRLSR